MRRQGRTDLNKPKNKDRGMTCKSKPNSLFLRSMSMNSSLTPAPLALEVS
tara:strand:- start:259 stop:408 length:150 start_codon:yes stop_codon:yes gene_type:complete